MTESIYDLQLHEQTHTIPGVQYLRVPGGWIVREWSYDSERWNTGVFVRFHNEFQEVK